MTDAVALVRGAPSGLLTHLGHHLVSAVLFAVLGIRESAVESRVRAGRVPTRESSVE